MDGCAFITDASRCDFLERKEIRKRLIFCYSEFTREKTWDKIAKREKKIALILWFLCVYVLIFDLYLISVLLVYICAIQNTNNLDNLLIEFSMK